MKNAMILLAFCFLMACKSKKDSVSKTESIKIERIADTEINEVQKDKTTALGNQILMTCNTSKFKPLTDKEATAEVRKNMTVDRLTKTCLKFKLKYGDFKELKFIEAYQTKTDKIIIYRFKALYEKKIANKELRITVNQNNQIAAIKSKDWVSDFHL